MLMLTLPLLIPSSILFTQLSHPLAMGLTLLTQTVLVSITVGLSTYSFWTSYILFLVFLGGMLVLFIYVASIASNQTFLFSSSMMMVFVMVAFVSFIFLLLDPLIVSNPSSLPASSMDLFNSIPIIISWIYNSPSMTFTIFAISYLLLTLIVVVKIVSLFKGPLRLLS